MFGLSAETLALFSPPRNWVEPNGPGQIVSVETPKPFEFSWKTSLSLYNGKLPTESYKFV